MFLLFNIQYKIDYEAFTGVFAPRINRYDKIPNDSSHALTPLKLIETSRPHYRPLLH